MRKKIISVSIIMCLIVALIPFGTMEADAATATYTISPGTSEISSKVYSTIYNSASKGNYKVVKIKGAYYVQFKYGSNIVNVKWPNMCVNKNKNDFTNTNKEIGKAISNRRNYKGIEVFQKTSRNSDSYRSYDKWSMVNLEVSGSYSNGKIALKCKNLSGLRITFASKYKLGNLYLKPKNCSNYKKCITIVKDSNAIEITPKWDIEVKKPGKNKNILSSYKISGCGYVTQKNNIDKLFEVYITIKNIATSSVPLTNPKNLYALYKMGADLRGSRSTGYNTGETFLLSKYIGNKYYKCMRATFKAPLKLTRAKDFYEVDVYLNNSISSRSPHTNIIATLSVSSFRQK